MCVSGVVCMYIRLCETVSTCSINYDTVNTISHYMQRNLKKCCIFI